MNSESDDDMPEHLTKVRQLDTGPYHRPDDFMGGGSMGPARGPSRKLKANWISNKSVADAGADSNTTDNPVRAIKTVYPMGPKDLGHNTVKNSEAESAKHVTSQLPKHSYRGSSNKDSEDSAPHHKESLHVENSSNHATAKVYPYSKAKNEPSDHHSIPKHSYRASAHETSKNPARQNAVESSCENSKESTEKHATPIISSGNESLDGSNHSLELLGSSFHSGDAQGSTTQAEKSSNISLGLESSSSGIKKSTDHVTQVRTLDASYRKPGEFMGGVGESPAPRRKLKATPAWLSDSHSSFSHSSSPAGKKPNVPYGEQSLPHIDFDGKRDGKIKSKPGAVWSTQNPKSKDFPNFGEQSLPNVGTTGLSSLHVDLTKKDPLNIGLPDSKLDSSDSSLDDMNLMPAQQEKNVAHIYGHRGAPLHPAPLGRVVSGQETRFEGLSVSLHEPRFHKKNEQNATLSNNAKDVSDADSESGRKGVGRSNSYQHHKLPSLQKAGNEGNNNEKLDTTSTTTETDEIKDNQSKTYYKPDEFIGGYKEKSTEYKIPEHLTQVRYSPEARRRPNDFMGGGTMIPDNAPRRRTLDPKDIFGKK